MPSSHVNIDGDVIVYSVGFASQSTMHVVDGKRFEEKKDALSYADRYGFDEDEIVREFDAEPIEFALSSAKRLVKRIVESSQAATYTILITGDNNYREDVAKFQPYKGNRLNDDGTSKQPKPVHFQAIKDYLLYVCSAEMVEGEEADDQLSIRAVESGHTIATIDKDLNNTAGWHYNWQRDTLYEVGTAEADRNFYTQLFSGDATDHIPGLFKFTGKRATAKMKAPLQEMTDPAEMWKHVLNTYMDALKIKWQKAVDEDIVWDNAHMAALHRDCSNFLEEIGILLWMRRQENEMWTPPKALSTGARSTAS